MNRPGRRLRRCLIALFACHVAVVSGNSVEELQASGHLELSSSLTPATGIVPGQKASLNLKIATDRWFTGGTGITIPEVPGLIILQTEQFASNASETREGQSWVVQNWTLDVYPQRAGEFTIPPIPVQVKVNSSEYGDVRGKLLSQPTRFDATIPEGLVQAESWVAAPSFTVRQSFDRSLDELEVGDAFEREIEFEAADVMAMMLPTVTPRELQGLAAYPSPPALENNSNRGQSTATRTQQVSYVVEAEGEYVLPGQEYFWWDTQEAKLKLLSLPTTTITVGAGVTATENTGPSIAPRQLLTGLAGLVLLAGFGWLLYKWLPRLPLARFNAAVSALWRQLQALRKPALPARLNPGSSAGE